jgi:hypothetical protein
MRIRLMGDLWKLHRLRLRCTGVPVPDRSASGRLSSASTALGAVVLIAVLSACSPEPGPTSPPPSSSSPSSTVVSSPDPGDVRGRLAAALQDTSPANARMVSDPKTSLTPLLASWLAGWQILDVQNQTPPHPRRFYAALSDTGQAVMLSGQPAAFSTMLTDAEVSVSSADVATEIAATFLDSTRDFVTYAYRIDDVDDIQWQPTLTAEQQKARDQIVSEYGDQVAPASAEQTSSGWTVTVWMVSDTDLVRHEVSVGTDGTVSDKTETVASDLPVPGSR